MSEQEAQERSWQREMRAAEAAHAAIKGVAITLIEKKDAELAALRAAILALAGELDGQAIVGMGIRDMAKRLRGIAGGE